MVGKPEYLRLKHNEALKKIQRKFKPHCTEVKEREYENVMQLIVGHLENKKYILEINIYIITLFEANFQNNFHYS